MKGKPTGEKLKKNLEWLALAVSDCAQNAFSAAVVQFASLAYFMHHGEDVFRTNPANTLPHIALRALEDQSILEFYERFTVTRHYSPVAFRSREVELLRQHRDLIGHPATIEWGSDHRQKFFDENRHSHFKCGLLWSIAKKLDAALLAQGSQPRLASIPANYHLAETMNLILRLSVKPESIAIVPSADGLLTYLNDQRAGIVEVLERFPEGTVPPTDDDDHVEE